MPIPGQDLKTFDVPIEQRTDQDFLRESLSAERWPLVSMQDRSFAILLLLGAFVASLINERLPSRE
jgi:hypothetical protein